MMGWIFTIMLVAGIAKCVLETGPSLAFDYMLMGADSAVELSISLAGSYIMWMGIMNVCKAAGIIDKLAHAAERPLRFVMPNIGSAAAPVTLNLAANFFGLGNAATPFGIEAMQQLNREGMSVASNNICMFLALNSSAVELLPTTVIAIRSACGSVDSMAIAPATFASSVISAVAAILLCKVFEKIGKGKRGHEF